MRTIDTLAGGVSFIFVYPQLDKQSTTSESMTDGYYDFNEVRVQASESSIRYEQHLRGLPTLDDLIQEISAENPSIEKLMEQAHQERYSEMIKSAESGEISRLAAERIYRGLTQGELAKLVGTQQANISRMEQPGAEMRPSTAKKIAKALGLEDYRVLL